MHTHQPHRHTTVLSLDEKKNHTNKQTTNICGTKTLIHISLQQGTQTAFLLYDSTYVFASPCPIYRYTYLFIRNMYSKHNERNNTDENSHHIELRSVVSMVRSLFSYINEAAYVAGVGGGLECGKRVAWQG